MSWIVILIIAAVGIAAAVADARKTSGSGSSGSHSVGSGGSRKTGTLIEHPHYCADSDLSVQNAGNALKMKMISVLTAVRYLRMPIRTTGNMMMKRMKKTGGMKRKRRAGNEKE